MTTQGALEIRGRLTHDIEAAIELREECHAIAQILLLVGAHLGRVRQRILVKHVAGNQRGELLKGNRADVAMDVDGAAEQEGVCEGQERAGPVLVLRQHRDVLAVRVRHALDGK